MVEKLECHFTALPVEIGENGTHVNSDATFP